jgi:hypothetical protein
MSTDRFGELRAIFQRKPGEVGWRALVEELALWEGEALEQVALPYAEAHLEAWPDALREEWSWEFGFARDGREPRLALLRVLRGMGSADEATCLLRSPALYNVRTLRFTRPITLGTFAAISQNPALAQLSTLHVNLDNWHSEEWLEPWLTLSLRALRVVEISWYSSLWDHERLPELLAAPCMASVERLVVGSHTLINPSQVILPPLRREVVDGKQRERLYRPSPTAGEE